MRRRIRKKVKVSTLTLNNEDSTVPLIELLLYSTKTHGTHWEMSGIFNCFEDQEMSFQDISQKNKIYQIVIQSTEFYN